MTNREDLLERMQTALEEIPEEEASEKPLSGRDIVRQMVQHAIDAAKPLAVPDHVFTGRWLEEQFGLGEQPPDSVSYQKWLLLRLRLIERWKEEMIHQLQTHVEVRVGHGYVVIAPEDTVRVAGSLYYREAKKTATKTQDKLMLTSMAGLTQSQKQERRDMYDHIGRIQQAIETARPRPPRRPDTFARELPRRLPPPREEPES